MKISIIIFFTLAVFATLYFLTGGIYRMESISAGVVHRLNIVTGEISICSFGKGCEKFTQPRVSSKKSSAADNLDKFAIIPIEYIRKNYPEYNDITDKQLATDQYNKYITKTGIQIDKNAFYKVIGYTSE